MLELNRTSVDVNPEYAESIENDTFNLRVMFEDGTSSLPALVSSHPTLTGNNGGSFEFFSASSKGAFEAGLDEV